MPFLNTLMELADRVERLERIVTDPDVWRPCLDCGDPTGDPALRFCRSCDQRRKDEAEDLQDEQEREGHETCPACGAEPGVIGYDPSYIGPHHPPPCPRCEERDAESEQDAPAPEKDALDREMEAWASTGIQTMADEFNRIEADSAPAPSEGEIEPDYGEAMRRGLADPPAEASEGYVQRLSEGEEGEAEPVVWPVAYRSWDAGYWYYRDGPPSGDDPREHPLYSHETVQRLQRERDEAREKVKEIVDRWVQENEEFARTIQELQSDNARLRDPANWEVVNLYTVRYVGPPESEGGGSE